MTLLIKSIYNINFLSTSWLVVLMVASSGIMAQVQAGFLVDKTEGCGTFAVNFLDQSSVTDGTITDWLWDLGGVVSTKQNPGRIFSQPGSYTICLTVKTSKGATSKLCKDQLIKVYQNPVADFIVDATSGCSPLTVNFINKSTSANGAIISWVWDIGGSANLITSTDSLQNILTAYNTESKYSPSLSVTDAKGCKHTVTKPDLISVTTPPRVDVRAEYINTCNYPWIVRFTNIYSEQGVDYQWDFGNGTTYSGVQPPNISYNQAGSFSVKVIAKKGPCTDTLTFTNLVNTERKSDFKVADTILCVGNTIKFEDISNFQADSVLWDFGDGNFSRLFNPEHTFTTAGCYTVKLKRFTGNCPDMVVKPCLNVLALPDVIYDISNQYSCKVPVDVSLSAGPSSSGQFTWNVSGTGVDTMLTGPGHTLSFNNFGKYDVTLQYKDSSGCIRKIDTIDIDLAKFEAMLPARAHTGCVPFNAVLTDSISSVVPLNSWYWEVGNPAIFTSTDRNPVFMVKDTGVWDLKLIVGNEYGCTDTITRRGFIKGGTPPEVDFSVAPLNDCLVTTRDFTALTSDNADFWVWSYGTGTIFSMEQNPTYAIQDVGTFDITLTAYHNGCQNRITKDDLVEVFKPKSQFEVTYDCENPSILGIENQSQGADSLYWVVHLSDTVRDTIRDSLLSSYTFPGRGIYILSHYSYNFDSGCEHVFADSIFITDLKAAYTLDTISGCAPLAINVKTQLQDAVTSMVTAGNFTVTQKAADEYSAIYTDGGKLPSPVLTATDRHGCIDTFQSPSTIDISKIRAVIDVPNVLCVPDSVTLVDGTVSGLGTIISRRWYYSGLDTFTTASDPVFGIINPGVYATSLSVRDSWGCRDSVYKEFQAVTLIPEFTADTLSCTSRAVRFSVNSDPSYLNAFSWDFGDGMSSNDKNPVHVYGSEGRYDVCAELFDSRGCSKKICKPSVVRIVDPVADFSGDPITAPCPPLVTGFDNDSKNATKFTWDFGDNSGYAYTADPSHVYTTPGTYPVTLIAEMIPGCADTLMRSDYISLPGPLAQLDFEVTGNCTPLEIRLQATSDKPYQYIWDFGDGQIKTLTGNVMGDTISYQYLNPGNYVPKLLVTDDTGCSRFFAVDPVQVNSLNTDFSVSDSIHCGKPAQFTLTNKTVSTSPSVQYTWNVEGPENVQSIEENPSLTVNTYGSYTVTLISSATNCVDTLRKEKAFENASFPAVTFEAADDKLCEQTKLTFKNNTTTEYGNITKWVWTFADKDTSSLENPLYTFDTIGMYKIHLKAITDKGCSDEYSTTVSILPNTRIKLDDDKLICIGDSTDLSANITGSENFDFNWESNPLINCPDCNTVNVKPAVTTTFYLHSISQSGCENRDSIKVTVVPVAGPKLELSGDTIVCKDSRIPVTILNFNSAFRYEWDQNDAGLDCYTDCKSPYASPDEDTWYSVTVYNTYGCSKEDSILVTVEKSIPDFLTEDVAVCEKQSTRLTLTGVNTPIWKTDPTLSCTDCLSPLVSPLKTSYYYVSVTSDAGCLYRDSVLVEVVSLSSIDAGDTQLICKGETVRLSGKGQGNVTWTGNWAISDASQLATTSAPQSTSYFVLTAVKDMCVLKDSVLISVIEKAEIEAKADTICYGESCILRATGNATEYLWLSPDKKNLGTAPPTVSPEVTSVYTVIGKRGICINDTVKVEVFVYDPIDYAITENIFEIYANSKALLDAEYNPDAGYTYQWTPSNGLSCTDCPEPEVQHLTQSTSYVVTVGDPNGCSIEETVNVRFINKCGKAGFYIPNIFTPYNRDGVNDEFFIYAEEEAELLSVTIFDRWGEKVYHTEDPAFRWDGLYNGRQMAQGVYTFIATGRCNFNNETFNFTGDITIIE